MGREPQSCCGCCGCCPGQGQAWLSHRWCLGSRDKAAAGVLVYWKSLIGTLASVGGWHGFMKSGKSLPSIEVINPSATIEERSWKEQPRAALGS